MSRKPRSKTLTEQEEAMNKSIRSYNSDEDEDVSISSFPPSRPIKRRRRILLGVSDDDDSPPKKRKSSPPAEGSPVIDLCEESQSGDAGKEEHEESKSVVHQLQDVEPASHENNENEIQDAQLHAEEEKTSVRSGAPSRVNRDDGMVPNQIDIPESFRRESVGHQTASNNQGSVSEASSRSMVPSRSDTQPGFPQDNIFLSEVGENRTWNDLLERFYKMVEARGPLDLKTIKESDSELGE
ncbi:hypothetical protein FisN_3Hu584 [Fistulifera solaris]|uniref:Uncharacterized protein n=1 Tax=Fistulifera solaris TaxID=1519565 RepID=A0A1Z5K312_FISSO|nr:hypothetical protein FisN_3Hu584 [Fistulifera solaris]|eukprot:GAX20566.1 hypothetical protein FisN_3Hu584 [Fistulifera solaris]